MSKFRKFCIRKFLVRYSVLLSRPHGLPFRARRVMSHLSGYRPTHSYFRRARNVNKLTVRHTTPHSPLTKILLTAPFDNPKLAENQVCLPLERVITSCSLGITQMQVCFRRRK